MMMLFLSRRRLNPQDQPPTFFGALTGGRRRIIYGPRRLLRTGGFTRLPDLILLDLKIPLMDGLELLRWIREQPAFRNLIVVILTASSQQRDIDEAYALQANCFLTKPSSMVETTELAKSIALCWLKNLPTRKA